MSTLETNTIKPISGSSTLTLGESGDTVSLGTGVTAGTGISDGKILISAQDTTKNYLQSKIVAGSGMNITLNGAGSNESITFASSGGMVLLASVSSTGSSSGIFVNGCFSSTYINYLFTYNIDFSSDGAKARVRFTNSSNAEQTSTYKQSSIRDSGSSSASSLYNSTNYFVLNDDGQSNFDNIPLTGHMYVTDPNSSSDYTAFRNFASTSDAGRNSGYEISGGHYSENTSIAGLSIYPSGGNFEAWNFKVYGLVES